MMKKAVVVFGLGLLLLAFSLPAGSGQMGPMTGAKSPEELHQEITVLKALNRMELSKEQLEELLAIVSELKAAHMEMMQPAMELREFLLGWQGSREEFEKALAPLEEKAQAAHRAFQEKLKASVEQIKDLLSFRQGEMLMDALAQLAGPPMGMGMMDMEQMREMMEEMMARMREHMQQMGMMPMMQQMKERMRERMQAMRERIPRMRALRAHLEEVLIKHLDLLERLLREKLERIKG